MIKQNLRILSVLLCMLATAFFTTGCKSSVDDAPESEYYDVSLNVYDAILATKASRSILPDVGANALYFTVAATNNAGSWDSSNSKQNDDGTATDMVYYPVTTKGVPTEPVTLNLKAGNYWRISAYGTKESGAVGTPGSTETTEAQALTRVKAAAIVSGSISFYLGSNGTLYQINGNLVAATPAGDAITTTTISTTASSSGTGSISLPIRTTAAGGIGYIKAVFTGRALNGSTPDTPALTASFTAGDVTTTLSSTAMPAGIYDVDITFAASSTSTTDLYQWHDTLTVWGGITSKWDNTVAGNYTVDSAGTITGTTGALYLDVSTDDVTNFKRIIYYVAQTTLHILPAGSDTTGTGSLFKPYATVGKALTAIKAANDGTSEYHVVVDGAITETDTTSLGSVYVAPATTDGTLKVVIRNFAATTASVAEASTESPVLYTTGSNTSVTLQNISFTGAAAVKSPTLILSNASISGVVTLATGSYLSVDVDDTTSYVGSITPSSLVYSSVVIKEWERGTGVDNADAENFTAEWLAATHGSGVLNFQLTSTFVSSYPLAVLAVDTDTASNTTCGDIIMKRKSAFGIDISASGYTCTMSAGTSSWTVTTDESTLKGIITDMVTIVIKNASGTEVATGTLSGVKAVIYDKGTSYSLSADDATSRTPKFSIPGFIRGAAATYTMEVSGLFTSADSSVNELFAGNITLSVTN